MNRDCCWIGSECAAHKRSKNEIESFDVPKLPGYKPRKIEKRFLGLRESTWFILMLAAFLMIGVIGSTLDMLDAFTVPEAEASFVDYQEIHETYDGQTREVCAKILSV